MTDKTDLNEQLKLIISLRSDGNHVDLTDEYENGYIEGQADSITELFIEQACAIGDDHKDRTGFIIYGTQQEAFNQGIEVMQQAIRDRFKPSED